MKQVICVLVFALFFQSCYKEEVVYDYELDHSLELPLILRINNKDCGFDLESNTLRYPIENDSIIDFSPLMEFNNNSKIYFNNELLKNQQINNLGNIKINLGYEVEIRTNNQTKQLKLFFTNLPIVQVTTPNQIFDDPKTLARITVNYQNDNEELITSYIGLEYRGATSQKYPKKSFGFSFLNSLNTNDEISRTVFDMRNNTDWILDAMYIDKACLRNKVSFEIWSKLDGEKHYGIDSELVELYINNEHQGLYCLNENINSELLELSDADAVLYKATAWGKGQLVLKRIHLMQTKIITGTDGNRNILIPKIILIGSLLKN